MSLQAPPPAPALQGLPTILPFSQTLPRSPLPPASVPLPPGLTQPGPVLLDGHPLRGLLFFIHHHQRGGRTRRLGDHCEGGHTTERERGGAGEAGLGQPGRGGPDPSKGWTWGHPSKRGPWCLWGGGGDRPGPPRPPSPLGAQDLPPQLDLELELRLAQAGGGLGGRGGGGPTASWWCFFLCFFLCFLCFFLWEPCPPPASASSPAGDDDDDDTQPLDRPGGAATRPGPGGERQTGP